ncbi:ABC transporter permease [Wenzhouxiangella sp. XN79A]|uniref:FtsX-like permease family protein n=1 Tax=Wenzhouxiangella sp. XN79A TaxID=2724193 RepID=UPI00144A95D1|nr:ABC transporter permease [Wenzhouxiangella sp. XN79A]NKI35684.1 ABC transporter permease [Wenzhouxiangella sp. XN79A]
MRARLSHGFFRRHPGQWLLALVGIAAGMAVVTGVALLRGALVDSLDAAADELAGRDSIVVRPLGESISPERFAELARLPGAPDWVPVVRIPVRVGDVQLEVIGLDGFSAVRDVTADSALAGDADRLEWTGDGPPPAAIGRETAALLGVEPGETLTLEGPNGPADLALVGTRGAGLDRRLVMDIAVAQHAFDLPTAISELLAPGSAAAWIERNLPADLQARTLDQQRASARELTAGLRANLTAMSLLALATGLFVVYSVLSFLMVQRRRSFGVLRAIGLTPGDLARMLAQEGLVLGALGTLAGLVVGTLLADLLLALIADPVRSIYGQLALARTAPSLGLYGTLFGLGVLAATAVTLPVVREALRVPPGRLVRAAEAPAPDRVGWALAGLPVALGLAWLALDPGLIAALGGLFLVLAGLATLIPRTGFGLLAVLARLAGGGLTGRAIRLLGGSRRRLAPALSALSLALALAMGMGMMILGFRASVDDWVQRLLQADLYVSATERRLTVDEVDRLAALDAVAAISTVSVQRLADQTRLTAYRLPDAAWSGFEWLAGDPERVRAGFVAGRGVAVSEPLARARGLAPGDLLELPLAGGPRRFEVLGVFRDYSSDAGFVAIDADQLTGPDAREVDSVGLYATPGGDRAALEADLRAAFGAAGELQWIGPAEIRDQSLSVFDRTFRISWAMAVLVGGIALVALVSALLAHGFERAREYATLRALGLSPAALFRLVVAQTLALTLAAALLAVPIAVVVHYALALFIQPRAFGWSVPAGLPPLGPVVVVVPLALLLGALAGLIPAARIGRRAPVSALRAG